MRYFAAALAALLPAAHAEEVKLEHGGLAVTANLETAGEAWTEGPVLLMTHGTKMEPVAARKANVQFAVIEDAGHFFRDLFAEDLADVAVDFIEAH